MKKIVVYGCGGHAKVIADIIKSEGKYTIACYYDNKPPSNIYNDVPVFSSPADLTTFIKQQNVQYAVVAIGNNSARKKLYHEAIQLGLQLPVIAHPTAVISESATIGNATVVMPGVIINASTSIADAVILNTGAIIEHDCSIASFAHIAPGSVICGGVKVGELTLIGARTVVIPLKEIGKNSVVGAGSVVITNVSDDICTYGTPARSAK